MYYDLQAFEVGFAEITQFAYPEGVRRVADAADALHWTAGPAADKVVRIQVRNVAYCALLSGFVVRSAA
jgi:hypothetical protein